jgi:predicted signal transduction protein with EAL and GGDEF domain
MAVAGLPKFTVSFGVVGSDPDVDLPTLISRADAALFQAKREGRDRIVVFGAPGYEERASSATSALLSNGNGRVIDGRDALEVADALSL